MRKMLISAAAAAAALSPLIVPTSSQATPSSTLSVNLVASGSVVAGCTALTQSAPLAFGTAMAPGTTPSATGGISATCASGVPATITFSAVTSNLTSTATASSTLAYGIFEDTTHLTPVPVAGIAFTGSGTASVTHVYGLLAAAVPADTVTGAYTDTIAVTLTF
jgi:spore coat protein U-like protein